ncbi:MAG: hypothetical protein OYH77_00525 [Pseudomonadota bacterium]|nr:hypothetical protein [Pseudomonadota bacterium]
MNATSLIAREQVKDFICDAEMLNCRVADADMALGDNVGFFDHEGKLYAIGEVVRLAVGIREVEIIQLFSRIADDALVRVITDDERKNRQLNPHTYRPSHLIGVSFAYKRLSLVDSVAGFNYGIYVARRVHEYIHIHIRSSYAYATAVIQRQERDAPHTFDVQAVIMSFYPGITFESFPRKPVSFFAEFGAGIASVSTARPDGVVLDEEFAGQHLLLHAMGGLQFSHQYWRLQAGIAQQFIGGTGAIEFTTTLTFGLR